MDQHRTYNATFEGSELSEMFTSSSHTAQHAVCVVGGCLAPVRIATRVAKAASRMVLSQAELEAMQLEAMADDVEIEYDRMAVWTREQAMRYFESGGTDVPPVPSAAGSESIAVVAPVVALSLIHI